MTRSEEHTSELQSPCNLVCRLLLEKKKKDKAPSLAPGILGFGTSQDRDSVSCVCPKCHVRLVVSFRLCLLSFFFFFFNDTATPEIYTLSLHDALPICFGLFCTASLSTCSPSAGF